MASKRIVIDAAPREDFTVSLVGAEYVVTPPKSTVLIAFAERAKNVGEDPAAVRVEIDEWVRLAFGKKQATKVIARLDDSEDALDIQHVVALMKALVEAATGDPST